MCVGGGGGGAKLPTGGASKKAGGDMSPPSLYVKRGLFAPFSNRSGV